DAGYAVWFLDRRGSGLNNQARGDAPSFQRLLDDVAEFLRTFSAGGLATRRRIPLLLGGISWGGKLAVALQRRHPGLTDGLLLICPGFFPRVGLPLNERLAVVAANLRSRTRCFPIPLNDPDLFTATPRWRQFIRADPLPLRQATGRLLLESVRLDMYCHKAVPFVNMPTLLLLAGQDRIICNERTHRYFHHFLTTDKNVITYPEAHHTLEFEPEP